MAGSVGLGSVGTDLRERVGLYLRETGSDQSVVGYLRDDSPERLVGTLEQVAERLAA